MVDQPINPYSINHQRGSTLCACWEGLKMVLNLFSGVRLQTLRLSFCFQTEKHFDNVVARGDCQNSPCSYSLLKANILITFTVF